MTGEAKILIGGVVILAFGIGKAALEKKPLDKPIVGGLAFILLLSLVSALSEPLSNLAGDFAILGVVTVLLVDGPEVITQLNKQVGTGASTTSQPGFINRVGGQT